MKGRAALFALVLLAGCSSLPAERSIRIDLPTAGTATFRNFTIALRPFAARGVLQERNLAYIDADTPTDVKQADTITWEEPPEAAAATYLAEALRRAGADVTAAAPYNLSGTVERFELVDGGGSGIATVAVDITVTDTKAGKTWFTASYCAKSPAGSQKLTAVQTAFDAALAQVAAHLVSDLGARAKGGPAPDFTPHGSRLASC